MDFDSVATSRNSAADKRRKQLKLKRQREERAASQAKKKEEELQVIQEKAREERRREKSYNDTVAQYTAGVKNPYRSDALLPFAVKGGGDKIVLPESWVGIVGDGVGVVTLRIGIKRDPAPSTDIWRDFDWKATPSTDLSASFNSDDMQDENDDAQPQSQSLAIVRHSLSARWTTYTHCGVLSFTAKEGDVGITER
jgi:hypothetical protein